MLPGGHSFCHKVVPRLDVPLTQRKNWRLWLNRKSNVALKLYPVIVLKSETEVLSTIQNSNEIIDLI